MASGSWKAIDVVVRKIDTHGSGERVLLLTETCCSDIRVSVQVDLGRLTTKHARLARNRLASTAVTFLASHTLP